MLKSGGYVTDATDQQRKLRTNKGLGGRSEPERAGRKARAARSHRAAKFLSATDGAARPPGPAFQTVRAGSDPHPPSARLHGGPRTGAGPSRPRSPLGPPPRTQSTEAPCSFSLPRGRPMGSRDSAQSQACLQPPSPTTQPTPPAALEARGLALDPDRREKRAQKWGLHPEARHGAAVRAWRRRGVPVGGSASPEALGASRH
ncbi:unnamed protein product [Rangifer tarandus platyrhynchus]|uniref:Uncharacterized protein n=1 Tax=Rangifer tarandus platyrhynchus TaxID=3082113 RepID=A0AC59YSU8_RANTA